MSVYTVGIWLVKPGCEEEFVAAWREMADWTVRELADWTVRELGGASGTLLRDRDRPRACIIDSQSVKTTTVGGIRSYDGSEKISERKRHLLFDVSELVLRATVHAADVQDRAAVSLVLGGVNEKFPLLEHAWVDQGHTGKGKTWVEEQLVWSVVITQPASCSRRVAHYPRPI